MPELVVFVARHGETDWNAEGRIQGHKDIPLNEAGRDQARGLAASAKKRGIAAVGASDLLRAKETAEIVARALELDVTLVDAGLRERSLGVFEGLTREECETRFPDEWTAWRRDPEVTPVPDAEPYDAFRERVVAAIARATRKLSRPDKPALVVTHGGALKALIRTTVSPNALVTIPNAALFRFVLDGKKLERRAD
jgi:probable phosphoglycerate mutase